MSTGSYVERLKNSEELAQELQQTLRTPLKQACRRTLWAMVDKVLIKGLDFDARIVHLESFSQVASRLELDVFGDHAVTCGVGPFRFARHGSVSCTVACAAKEASYAVLEEQVIPDLCSYRLRSNRERVINEARLDLELCGHAEAPDRLLDCTVWHPAAPCSISRAAGLSGYAASCGVEAERRRYPARAGTVVEPRSAETWVFLDPAFDALLEELAVLAADRQRARGVQPSQWLSRWRSLLGLRLAICVAKAILCATPLAHQPGWGLG